MNYYMEEWIRQQEREGLKEFNKLNLPVVSNNEVTVCGNCGSTWVIKTYDGYWCKHCKTEL